MSEPIFQRVADGFQVGKEVALRVRIFRLICALAAGLCLFVVAPINAVQNLPLGVHVANLFLGLLGAFCYWWSCRGHHLITPFFLVLVLMVDVVWFWNAGSEGSVTYFYFPVMLFIIVLSEGRWRWLLATALWLNVSGLILLEHFFPSWVTPFQSAHDRLIDTVTGLFCSFVTLAAGAWFILSSYSREQRRVAEITGRLCASEAHYREIFNSTSDALVVHAVDGTILDVNERACALFGVERAGLVGRAVGTFGADEQRYWREEAGIAALSAAPENPQVFEWRGKRSTGEFFWAEVALRALSFQDGRQLVASVRDISGRKEAQQALALNEERLRLAMEASHQGWFELNVQTGESVSSPEYIRMLEYQPAEFRSNQQEWIGRIHPADRTKVLAAFQHGLKGAVLSAVEYRQRTKSGGWKWIRSAAKVVEYDAAGRPLRVMGTHTDVTDRKELESQLLHSQRLEAVGTLASGVAHDLNNILTPVLMASGVLREKITDPHDRELMAMLDEGGRRGAAIVRQLLAFSRNLAQDRIPVDPRQLLRDMVQLMRATFPKEIQVTEEFAEGVGLVEAEPNQLHQVLTNLCVNARDAMPGGGVITLGLARVDVPARADTKGGPHVVLSVADRGAGIPPELLDKIFDPFFTTKPVGQGTGLGLASVHGIVKAHGGFVRVESQPGQGSVFQVLLPVYEGPVVEAEEKVVPTTLEAGRTIRRSAVLIVDDEAAVRLITGRFVERLGHRAIPAEDGPQALALMAEHLDEIALVITDFSMPGMDGPALVPRLRALKPDLKIIGVSGLNHTHRMEELVRLGFSEVLAKPYELGQLLMAVQRQLPPTAAGVDSPRRTTTEPTADIG